MKKRLLLLVLIGVLMLAYNINTFALLGDQAIPQPVYRVPMGSEVKYLEESAQKLLYMNEQVLSLKNQLDQYNDQEAVFRAVFGNSKLLKLRDHDFDNMNLEDWREFIRTTADIIYGDIELVKSSEPKEASKERKNQTEETLNVLTGQGSSSNNNNSTSNENQKEEKMKKLNDRKEALEKLYLLMLSRYEVVETTKSNPVEAKENSIPQYIQKTQKDLGNIEKNMVKDQNLEKSNISALLQSLNKQMLLNNQINLKILQTLSDQNKIDAATTVKSNYEQIKEDYIELKHKELR